MNSVAEIGFLRQIFDLVQDSITYQYRARTNKELKQLYGHPDIVRIIKMQILRWAGHVKRQRNERFVQRRWEEASQGKLSLGTPRMTWGDNVATAMVL